MVIRILTAKAYCVGSALAVLFQCGKYKSKCSMSSGLKVKYKIKLKVKTTRKLPKTYNKER